MGLEQAKQPRSFGQFREQRAPISNQPAIKGAISHSLERKQNGQGDDFAGIQVGLWMFREVSHLIIYSAEQFNDKIFGGHEGLLLLFGELLEQCTS
jgi:hypothetical protein